MRKPSKPQIKVIFFDDGDVLRKFPGPKRSELIAKFLGHKIETVLPLYLRRFKLLSKGHITERQFLETFANRYRVPHPLPKEYWNIFSSQHHGRPTKAVWAIARKLKRNGYRIGILSNTIPVHRDARTQTPYSIFKPVVLSCDVGSRKPELNIYRTAARQGRVKLNEMVFFDDRQENVATAKKLGIKAFQYKNPRQLEQSLRRLGVRL